MKFFQRTIFISVLIFSNLFSEPIKGEEMDNIYNFSAKSIDGESISLSKYRGNVLLIVNVASECGLTPQYSQLVELYENYKDKGFYVLGFPSGNFLDQEFATEKEIKSFCDINFRVTFPLFEKIDVNGDNTHPLFKYLKSKKSGFLGTEFIKWNFTKFLINRDGEVVNRYSPITQPLDIKEDIEKLF